MRVTITARWLLAVAVVCTCIATHSAATLDAMGDALEQDAADTVLHRTRSSTPEADLSAAAPLQTRTAHKPTANDNDGSTQHPYLRTEAGTASPTAKTPEKPAQLGDELSPAQLAAIGVTTQLTVTTAPRVDAATDSIRTSASTTAAASEPHPVDNNEQLSNSEPLAPRTAVDLVTTPPVKMSDSDNTATPVPTPLATFTAANVSIDHVEAHLQILQQLELSVAQSIDEMNAKMDARTTRRSGESRRISKELLVLQSNLKKLAESLNGTLSELVVVEKDSEQKSKQLQQVLEQQHETEQEQFLEAHGMKVVDYETGHIRNNTAGLSSLQLAKREAAEKKVDPAVLHYDLELLGQIAILLGVAAIGGIIATYVNVPPHVGYLLGGALVGPSCLGLVRQFKEVETLSLFGSIFLLFGHGAGYSPQQLDRHFKRYFVGGIAYITATVTLVALVAATIGWSASFSEGLIIGVAVCFTTTAPLYEYIRANQIHESSYGRTLTAIIAVQDVLMSFALGTPEWFARRSVGSIGVAAIRSIVSYGVVVALATALHTRVIPHLLRFLVASEHVHHAPLVLLGVVSVCLFMALFAETIGLSLECGAFFAGLAFVNASSDAKAAFTSIRVLENLFGSLFFACVGMILNPIFLLKNAGEILSLVVVIVAIKTIAMTTIMTFFRITIEKALLAAVGLCQIGELALIFMIKAHATKLVTRRSYLVFVAAIGVFLGCSSLVTRQMLLARRKTALFRLPSILRRRADADENDKDKNKSDTDDRNDADDDDKSRRHSMSNTSVDGDDVDTFASSSSSSGQTAAAASTPRRKAMKGLLH